MPNPSDQKRKRRSRGPREEKEFEEYLLQLDRVTRVVKGGRRMRFRATMVIGNRAGRVGLGIGKGNDVQIAVRKGVNEAKKHLIDVPIVNDTIPHAVKLKFKAARILILPAAPGTGLIAGSSIRKVLELAGIKNVLSKNIGSSNRVVVGQAMLKVLAQLRLTEAAKKFLAKIQKEKEEKKAKIAKSRKDSEKTGRSSSKSKPAKTTEAAPAEQSDLKKASDKIQKTQGRLEQEIEAVAKK